MSMVSRKAIAGGLLALACALDVSAAHAADPQSATAPTPPATPGTPLVLRPSAPTETTRESAPVPATGTVALALLVAAAGVGLWLRGRKAPLPQANDGQIRVLRRASLGARNEVVLIELDGQRILLGSTPNSIQALYHCAPNADAHDDAEMIPLPSMAAVLPPAPIEHTVALSDSRRRLRPSRAGSATRGAKETISVDDQARGLRALLDK